MVLAGGRLSPRPVAGGVSRSPVLGRADQIIRAINRFSLPIMISFKICATSFRPLPDINLIYMEYEGRLIIKSSTKVRRYEGILDFRQLWTPPRGKFSDLSARLLPEIFDRIAFERELKGNFAS